MGIEISNFLALTAEKISVAGAYLWQITKPMLYGSKITLSLFFIVIILSIPIGFCLTLAAKSKIKLISRLAKFFIYIMRGTPLLLQLLFVFFGLPTLPYIGKYLAFERFTAACVAFTLNYAAYFAEIYRSGIESIPIGQYEAAHVLGYTRIQTFIKIIMPQVIKRILPPVTNEVITLVKDTSLSFTLSVLEMFTIAKQISSSQTTMIPLIAAGVFYYIFNFIVAMGMEYIEKRLSYYR